MRGRRREEGDLHALAVTVPRINNDKASDRAVNHLSMFHFLREEVFFGDQSARVAEGFRPENFEYLQCPKISYKHSQA
jgi:hypothetical protein